MSSPLGVRHGPSSWVGSAVLALGPAPLHLAASGLCELPGLRGHLGSPRPWVPRVLSSWGLRCPWRMPEVQVPQRGCPGRGLWHPGRVSTALPAAELRPRPAHPGDLQVRPEAQGQGPDQRPAARPELQIPQQSQTALWDAGAAPWVGSSGEPSPAWPCAPQARTGCRKCIGSRFPWELAAQGVEGRAASFVRQLEN